MPIEHREVDVENQLRAFGVALEAHTAEPIRPGHRAVDDEPGDPVVVEPTPMPRHPDRRQWLLPAVAAAVAAIMLVAGLAVLSDNTTPSDTPTPSTATRPTPTTPTTTAPSTTTTPPTTAAPSTTVVGAAAPARTVVSELAVPEPDSTQTAIIGDITWTRLEDPEVPYVAFALDGLLYGSGFENGGPPRRESVFSPPGVFTSTDGINWDEFGGVPDEPTRVELYAVGGTLWAEAEAGSDSSLYRWDGSTFVAVELPTPAPAAGEGLVIKGTSLTVVGGFDRGWIVDRGEWFGIPWAGLFGVEPPLNVVPDNTRWTDPDNRRATDTFEVYEQQCDLSDLGFGGCERAGESWRIRPEVIDGDPTRIDLYDAGGELITTVVLPDDLLAEVGMEWVLYELGRYNDVGGRIDSFLVRDDGTVARIVDWPFTPREAQFAELDGRLYALSGGDGIERRLWVTSDLDTWDPVSLPFPVAGPLELASDGSTMILSDGGGSMYTTDDGSEWTAAQPLSADTWHLEAADFGWYRAGDDTLEVSADGATWQPIPVPVPTAIADRGLTWSDTDGETQADPNLVWYWDAEVYGDNIVIDLSGAVQGRELWIGRVEAS